MRTIFECINICLLTFAILNINDMQRDLWNEEWKDVVQNDLGKNQKYQISNFGRVKSFMIDKENGRLIKPTNLAGYKAVSLRADDGRRIHKYVHRLVADHFLTPESDEHALVLHIDYNKENNHVNNLKWVTLSGKAKHQYNNPYHESPLKRPKQYKLNEARVRLIKKKIFDPNRKTKMKMIARQFGISEMQLYRIKSGENWGHVKI